MAPFDKQSSEKLAYGMPIDMQKQFNFNFETIWRRKNFSGRLLLLLLAVACCCLLLLVVVVLRNY